MNKVKGGSEIFTFESVAATAGSGRGVTKCKNSEWEFSAVASFSGSQRAFCIHEYY